jgi:hypothetical protein
MYLRGFDGKCGDELEYVWEVRVALSYDVHVPA